MKGAKIQNPQQLSSKISQGVPSLSQLLLKSAGVAITDIDIVRAAMAARKEKCIDCAR